MLGQGVQDFEDVGEFFEIVVRGEELADLFGELGAELRGVLLVVGRPAPGSSVAITLLAVLGRPVPVTGNRA